jgi:hypothetical protein
MTAFAFDGYEIAGRHSAALEKESEPVIGNGETGCLFETPAGPKGFLQSVVTGEHWLIQTGQDEVPAIRVPMARLTAELTPVDPAVPVLPPFLNGAVYRFDENTILNRFSASGRTLSATFTVSPTRNLYLFAGESSFPVNLAFKVSIPDLDFPEALPLSATRAADAEVFALAQRLPRMESFGIGLGVEGGRVSSSTGERGWNISLSEATHWRLALSVVAEDEAAPLLSATLAEAQLVSATPNAVFRSQREAFWRKFWNRSVVDLSGSSSPLAMSAERSWVLLQHGLATHARGTYPPGDAGYGKPFQGGRPWSSTLWPLYRPWILTNHSEEIRCLAYPLLQHLEVKKEGPGASLLASEAGPGGVNSDEIESLAAALAEVGLVKDGLTWNEEGRLFSTLPLLVSLPAFRESRWEEITGIYPFLFSNANQAMAVLSATGEAAPDPALLPHLFLAIQAACQTAEDIQIDDRARKQWRKCLDATIARSGESLRKRLSDEVLNLPTDLSGPSDIEAFLAWLEEQAMTPEGVLLSTGGNRSLLKTGMALGTLVQILFQEKEGTLRILPGIPMDGSWNVHLEHLSVPRGLEVVSASMRKGVLDSFLLRSLVGGNLRLELPRGWSSAQVARVDEAQETIEIKRLPNGEAEKNKEAPGVIEFQTEAGGSYLIGPVW